MNSLTKPLNLFVLACLLIIGGLYFYSGQQEGRYRDTAVPYLRSAMHDISEWEVDAIWPHLSPQAQEVVTREQLGNLLVRYQPLGEFSTMEEPEFSRLAAVLSLLSPGRKISYSFKAYFENGEASVTATLSVDEDGSFSLYNFNLSEVTPAGESQQLP